MPPWSRVRQRIEREFAREQQQLAVARALIEDATRDTMLWIGSAALGNSAEERVHVLAMQKTLTDLARIIERQIEGRHEIRDAWEYSEGRTEVLSRLEQARQLHGGIIGRGLARLSDHLPRELPGSKPHKPRPKLPEPVRPVSTSSYVSHPAPETELPSSPPMYFPDDLWPQTNVILLAAQRKFPLQSQTLELCRHVTAEMTPVLCGAVKEGKMSATEALSEDLGGMVDLLRLILKRNAGASSLGSLSDEAYRLWQEVQKSDEWLSLAQAVAEAQLAQNSEKTTQSVESKAASRRPERADAEVAKRAALARANRDTPAGEMCEIFDRNSVPLPAKWPDAGFKTWSEAYKDSRYRSRIHTLISKDRGKN